MATILILLLPMDCYSKDTAENLKNKWFNNTTEMRKTVKNEAVSYLLPEFITACNNEQIDLENNWVTNVEILNF